MKVMTTFLLVLLMTLGATASAADLGRISHTDIVDQGRISAPI